ncbi:fluoride efflux transporter FluC [Natronococcus occultus]|uniref:Fluoride-specific ion channel FluC n=1 Tax=Natronococcus occultus SP4 TaxID=694430 RepID=L0JW52_9EURY|nr:Integral membrane protein possibly involved in chromosome condensation [Natronococcus occultus SP4]
MTALESPASALAVVLVLEPVIEDGALEFEAAHLVGIGGAIGALLRYAVYEQLSDEQYPWPTLVVNVVGSFVFGAATFAGVGESAIQLIGIGICGAFTTFSSFSVQTVQLYERGDRKLAVANAAGNLALSLAAIGLAWVLVAAL